jgi:hypothetical protein
VNDVDAASPSRPQGVVGPRVYSLALAMSVSDVSGKVIANLRTEEVDTRRLFFTATCCSASPRCSRSAVQDDAGSRNRQVHARVLD